MRPSRLTSWGRAPPARQRERAVAWRTEPLPDLPGTLLPFGRGRSYGDACLNDGGTLLTTAALDRLVAFDPASGLLACEAGITLDAILRRFGPLGWAPAVLPGTRHVTVGGAIANDVHGKNHHRAGTFGHHVRRLELLRSNGERIICGPAERPEWFAATVGGLGLTGLITWAELQLARVPGAWVEREAVPFRGLGEFLALAVESDAAFEHTVAWFDSLAAGERLGRGVLFRGARTAEAGPPRRERRPIPVPFELPAWALNRLTVGAFNAAYALAHRRRARGLVHQDAFFFPLDALDGWNRLYGRAGFTQLQVVLPREAAAAGLAEVLGRIARSRLGAFLSVLKTFGAAPPAGLLSFARPGVTLAVDLPNRGPAVEALVREAHAVAVGHGGAVYPAKDAHMTRAVFEAGFPAVGRFRAYLDPRFSSSLWRRVSGERGAV